MFACNVPTPSQRDPNHASRFARQGSLPLAANRKEGEGCYVYGDGRTYVGQWHGDLREGTGARPGPVLLNHPPMSLSLPPSHAFGAALCPGLPGTLTAPDSSVVYSGSWLADEHHGDQSPLWQCELSGFGPCIWRVI